MAFNLKGRSLLTLKDYTPQEIRYILDIAKQVKAERKAGVVHQRFLGKTIALIFENIEDTARVLGRMFDAIEFRGFKQETVEILAKYAGVPVYNGLTDEYHPTQVLADLMTIEEEFGSLTGRKLVFVGDGRNNMANTLAVGCAKMGMHYVINSPKELWPSQEFIDEIRQMAAENGGTFELTEEAKAEEREALLRPFQVNEEMMKKTGREDTIFLHCLPAVKGQEVTFDVIEGKQSRVWDQAENRKHTIKAVMIATLL
jgi:ornithine carbamoyltransferase